MRWRSVLDWPVGLQLAAQANARRATARLAERRREKDEIDDFVARHTDGEPPR